MLLVVGTVRLPPEKLSDARPVMARMVTASRAEPGCRLYAYAEDMLEPGLVRVTELWDDQAALDAHFASTHLAEWRSVWPALGLGERHLEVYEVATPRTT